MKVDDIFKVPGLLPPGVRVKLIDLAVPGYVSAVHWLDSGQVRYQVTYWWDGERREEELRRDEIEEVASGQKKKTTA